MKSVNYKRRPMSKRFPMCVTPLVFQTSTEGIPTAGPLRPGASGHEGSQPASLPSPRWHPASMGRSAMSSMCTWHSQGHVPLQGAEDPPGRAMPSSNSTPSIPSCSMALVIHWRLLRFKPRSSTVPWSMCLSLLCLPCSTRRELQRTASTST